MISKETHTRLCLKIKKKGLTLFHYLEADYLKEQYPVTAQAPNFDFRTGCREIKRCEESKRTLKNLFVSRFAEFNTTLTVEALWL